MEDSEGHEADPIATGHRSAGVRSPEGDALTEANLAEPKPTRVSEILEISVFRTSRQIVFLALEGAGRGSPMVRRSNHANGT